MEQVLESDKAAFCLNVALGTLIQEQRLTARVIAAVPESLSSYRPAPESRTALELAWHIVQSELMFLDGVAEGAFAYDEVAMPAHLTTPARIVGWYTKRFRASYARLRNLSGEKLVKPLDFRGVFQRPAVMFLSTAIRHTVHHRGQLSVYLRPLGARVPSIYGSSFDAAWPLSRVSG